MSPTSQQVPKESQSLGWEECQAVWGDQLCLREEGAVPKEERDKRSWSGSQGPSVYTQYWFFLAG